MEVSSRPQVAQVFSELCGVWRPEPDEERKSAARIVRHLRAGGHLLDVGCGTGSLLAATRAEAARRSRRLGRVIGMDLSPGMAAQASGRPGGYGVVGDAFVLPFRDQYFDVVVARHVLHFVSDPARAVREMVRVTLPGGTLILELMSPRSRRSRLDPLSLPSESLLRRYLELPRRYDTWGLRDALRRCGCSVEEVSAPPTSQDGRAGFLAQIARSSGTREDLEAADTLLRAGSAYAADPRRVLVARLPGPRRGSMRVTVRDLEGIVSLQEVRQALAGLPRAFGYEVVVKPLRYRTRPHVQAFCEFDQRRILIQVPVPFRPFSEHVPYRAERLRGKRLRFRWFARTLRFERPRELIRYLYLHEYYHWYLRECLGKPSAAETACDRFALQRL